MPKIDNHPLRLARIAAGLSMQQLADLAHIDRSTLAAIEDGRTAHPAGETVQALADALSSPELVQLVASFRPDPRQRLDAAGAIAVAMSPGSLALLPSWKNWRLRVAPTPNAYASLTGVNRTILSKYERAIAGTPMPEPVLHSLFVLGMTAEQGLALSRLPPNSDAEETAA